MSLNIKPLMGFTHPKLNYLKKRNSIKNGLIKGCTSSTNNTKSSTQNNQYLIKKEIKDKK